MNSNFFRYELRKNDINILPNRWEDIKTIQIQDT